MSVFELRLDQKKKKCAFKLTEHTLCKLSRTGLFISMNTISFWTPLGNPGSLVSWRALITMRAFLVTLVISGAWVENKTISALIWLTKRKLDFPIKSFIADLKKRIVNIKSFAKGGIIVINMADEQQRFFSKREAGRQIWIWWGTYLLSSWSVIFFSYSSLMRFIPK